MAMRQCTELAAAQRLRPPPDVSAGCCQDLSGLEDRELLALAGSLQRSSEWRAATRDLLFARYCNLVRSCVQRYSSGPEPAEDLMQVGYVGLLKAINGFDPALGFSLAGYAAPCINGELKKHFRDKSWRVRVGRTMQERVLEVRQAEQLLTQQLGRVPTDSDLAVDLGIGDADVRQAWQAELVLRPLSLDEPPRRQPAAASFADLLGEEGPRLEHMLGMQAIARHWGDLPVREQQIVVLYYYRGMTQAQIGQQLGLSQMQISRLLARALGYLRLRLFGQPEYESEAAAPRTKLTGAAPNPRRASSAPAANWPPAPKSDDLQGPAADDGRPEHASLPKPTAA